MIVVSIAALIVAVGAAILWLSNITRRVERLEDEIEDTRLRAIEERVREITAEAARGTYQNTQQEVQQ